MVYLIVHEKKFDSNALGLLSFIPKKTNGISYNIKKKLLRNTSE